MSVVGDIVADAPASDVGVVVVQMLLVKLRGATTYERPVRLAQLRDATNRLMVQVIALDDWLKRAWQKIDDYDVWLAAHAEVPDYAERVRKRHALEARLLVEISQYTMMHQALGEAMRKIDDYDVWLEAHTQVGLL
jgi:hypothetical protein